MVRVSSDSPDVKLVRDKRIPFHYFVVIRDGEDWRMFKDLKLMCELMGLDSDIANRFFNKQGYYTGFDFTVFRVQGESSTSHRGHHI